MAGPLRWGIAGCGKISSDFVNAVQHLGSDKHVVVAVAARNLNSAKEFAGKFGVPKYYDRYEALGEDSDVDVVYVGSINPTHVPICKAILNSGKPVLCEKPICMSVQDTSDLLSLAEKKNIFLMEAMWARCNPTYRDLKTRLENDEVGKVTHVNVTFGIQIAAINREYKKGLGWGCLLDFGIYPMNIILLAMGDERPISIEAVGTQNQDGADTEVVGTMKFSNNRFASFTLSSTAILPNEAIITGTHGTMKLNTPFWCTTTLTTPSGDIEFPLDQSDRVYNFDNSQALKYEAEEVAKCLKEGRKESSLVPHALSMKFAEILEQIGEQVKTKI